MITKILSAVAHDRQIDSIECAMLADPAALVDLPLTHRFTDGMYIREIFMPAGTLATSMIHNTEHPYVVLSGRVSVYIDGVGVQTINGPHFGITKAGTRRVLLVHEDTRWITFHRCTNGETVDQIQERIIERREFADGHTVGELYRQAVAALQAAEALTDQLEPQYELQGAP